MVMEMSKTYQYRKVMKPLLERKRRARINKCLDDLKDLMVECLTQEGEHVTRLEKADILELTVEHMRKLKQRGNLQLRSAATINAHVESFRSGYVHAADQISQVLCQQQNNDEVRGKIMKYLSTRLMDMQSYVRGQSPSGSSNVVSTVLQQKAFYTHSNTNSCLMPSAIEDMGSTYKSHKNSIASSKAIGHNDDWKENDMIDVITVDTRSNMSTTSSSSSSPSIESVDYNSSSESVWRPW